MWLDWNSRPVVMSFFNTATIFNHIYTIFTVMTIVWCWYLIWNRHFLVKKHKFRFPLLCKLLCICVTIYVCAKFPLLYLHTYNYSYFVYPCKYLHIIQYLHLHVHTTAAPVIRQQKYYTQVFCIELKGCLFKCPYCPIVSMSRSVSRGFGNPCV